MLELTPVTPQPRWESPSPRDTLLTSATTRAPMLYHPTTAHHKIRGGPLHIWVLLDAHRSLLTATVKAAATWSSFPGSQTSVGLAPLHAAGSAAKWAIAKLCHRKPLQIFPSLPHSPSFQHFVSWRCSSNLNRAVLKYSTWNGKSPCTWTAGISDELLCKSSPF